MLKVLIHLQRNKLISIFPAVKILSNNLNSKIMRVTKVEFKKSSSVAYRVAVKNEWIKEMTWIKGKINVDGK